MQNRIAKISFVWYNVTSMLSEGSNAAKIAPGQRYIQYMRRVGHSDAPSNKTTGVDK